jgi:hypothetical protein
MLWSSHVSCSDSSGLASLGLLTWHACLAPEVAWLACMALEVAAIPWGDLAPWSVINPEVLQDFLFAKKSNFFGWYSQISQCVWLFTKALICLLSPPTSNRLICGVVGRGKHVACLFLMYYQVENRILGSNKSYSLIKMYMCVYMVDGWRTPLCIWFSPLVFRFLRLGLCLFIRSLFFLSCSRACAFFLFFHSPQSLVNILGERVIMEQCAELY